MSKIQTRIAITASSCLVLLIILELGLRLGGYLYLERFLSYSKTENNNSQAHTILTIGDSYTAGGDEKWEKKYPSQLQKMLSREFPNEFNVINGGICEANTSQVLEYLQRLNGVYKIDSVILLAGSANRFNPAGFSRFKIKNYFLRMRIIKLARIFMANLKGKLFQRRAEKHSKKHISIKHDYALNKTMEWENSFEFCDENEQKKYEKARSLNPNDREQYTQLARCYIDRGEYENAEKLYKKVLVMSGGDSGAYDDLGRLYYKQGRFEDVRALYTELITKWPNEAWPYIKLAHYYMDRHEDDEVEGPLKTALNLNKDQFHTYIALARFYEIKGQFKESIKMSEAALKISQDMDVYADLAWGYIRIGDYEKTLEVLLESIELFPGEFMNYYSLLQSYQFQSKYDAEYILRVFNKIGEKNPRLKENNDFQNYVLFLKSRTKIEKDIDNWVRSDLEKIVSLCKANNINLIVQNYPRSFISANKILKKVAERHSLPFVDNYAIFNKIPPKDKGKYFTSDFGHCTYAGYKLMAENIYPIFKNEKD